MFQCLVSKEERIEFSFCLQNQKVYVVEVKLFRFGTRKGLVVAVVVAVEVVVINVVVANQSKKFLVIHSLIFFFRLY